MITSAVYFAMPSTKQIYSRTRCNCASRLLTKTCHVYCPCLLLLEKHSLTLHPPGRIKQASVLSRANVTPDVDTSYTPHTLTLRDAILFVGHPQSKKSTCVLGAYSCMTPRLTWPRHLSYSSIYFILGYVELRLGRCASVALLLLQLMVGVVPSSPKVDKHRSPCLLQPAGCSCYQTRY